MKIEQVLLDCAVVSPAAHSAATYCRIGAGSRIHFRVALSRSIRRIARLFIHEASDLGVAGMTVGQAEEWIAARIVAVAGRADPPRASIIVRHEEIVIFGAVVERTMAKPHRRASEPAQTGTGNAFERIAHRVLSRLGHQRCGAKTAATGLRRLVETH
jgi:hypothetical protein